MNTVTKQTHTPGALRAAQTITDWYEDFDNSHLIRASEIIDRETGAPEMLAALELLLSEMKEGQDSPSLGAMQKVYAAVCKAKGEV